MGKIESESVSPFEKMKLIPFVLNNINKEEEKKKKNNSTHTMMKKKKKTTKKGKNC